jgi:hypothetical protein
METLEVAQPNEHLLGMDLESQRDSAARRMQGLFTSSAGALHRHAADMIDSIASL